MKNTVCLLGLLSALPLFTASAVNAQDTIQDGDSVRTRGTLTGDWGGTRADMREKGFSFSMDTTQYYQGQLSGDGDTDFAHGGRVDAFINLDTGKLGWWQGGGLRTHFEYRYGDLKEYRGGALWPVNVAMLLPLGSRDEVVASSIFLTQRIGDRNTLMLGKINAVDLLASDPFFGGWGTERFMNIAFVAPPTGVVPPTIMGAVVSHRSEPMSYTFMLFDPKDRTDDYLPDDLFDTGVNLSLGAAWSGSWAGRASSAGITGTVSTADGADFEDIGLPPGVEGGTKSNSFNLALSLSHLMIAAAGNPGRGLGIYARAAIADGNPNVIQRSLVGGIAGHEIIPGRPRDSFGIGYFNYDFSDVLQKAVDPFVQFDDEMGVELFYNFSVTPWLRMTADVQWINPATAADSTMWVGALRLQLIF